jgi:hypothetical protein
MDSATPKGYYARLIGRANTSNWFHLAVPTVGVIEGSRLRIDSVMLRLRTSGAVVTSVHIYDGAKKIASHDGLSLRRATWAFARFGVPGNPDVMSAIGISFKGEFGSGNRRIEISSAGADFLQ